MKSHNKRGRVWCASTIHVGDDIGVIFGEEVVCKEKKYYRERVRKYIKLNFNKYLRSIFGKDFWSRVEEEV